LLYKSPFASVKCHKSFYERGKAITTRVYSKNEQCFGITKKKKIDKNDDEKCDDPNQIKCFNQIKAEMKGEEMEVAVEVAGSVVPRR
jgi:N-acetylmuramoyl-L-alanine amidase CwlA